MSWGQTGAKIAIIANFEVWNLQNKHRPQGKQSKGGICYFCWKVSEKFDLRCWNIWIPQFETKWIIQVGVRATFIGASVQLFSICRKYLLKMRGVAWDYFFVVGGEPGAPFICHLYFERYKDTKKQMRRCKLLAVILLLARFFSSVILQLGNTSQKKNRFLSGVAQITSPPLLELAILRLQQQDQAFMAHLGLLEPTRPPSLWLYPTSRPRPTMNTTSMSRTTVRWSHARDLFPSPYSA